MSYGDGVFCSVTRNKGTPFTKNYKEFQGVIKGLAEPF
jgi:hypothetical protein